MFTEYPSDGRSVVHALRQVIVALQVIDRLLSKRNASEENPENKQILELHSEAVKRLESLINEIEKQRKPT